MKMSDESLRFRNMFLSSINENHVLERCSCFLCGADCFEEVSQIDRYGFLYPTAMCLNCGNVQQSSYYNENTLVEFYSNYYRKIYGNASPQLLFSYQVNIGGAKIYDIVSKVKKPERVLEIGCGAGGILEVFKSNGCDVLGLDFDDEFLEIARSNCIPVKKGSIENLDCSDKFDVIIMSHVLEHIVKPAEFLLEVKQYLKCDGIIYIEVPSIDMVARGSYNHDLLMYFQNAHTIHFTSYTLELLCKTVGLEQISKTDVIESCWRISQNGRNLTTDELVTSLKRSRNLLSQCEKRRKSMVIKIRRRLIRIAELFGVKEFIRPIYARLFDF